MTEPTEPDVRRRQLDTGGENPGVQVAEAVAELDEKDATELNDIYGCVDGVLDHLFSDPPSPDAELEVAFNYEGYRVTVRQDGTAEFAKREP